VKRNMFSEGYMKKPGEEREERAIQRERRL